MFPMADGSDFDWDNPEHSKNPFINRDPRLCETILLDGDKFGSGVADIRKEKAARKFVLDRQGEYKNRLMQWPILRLAEIYLSYAEALNEANHGPNATAYEYVNKVRRRVGLGDLKTGLSQEQFREFSSKWYLSAFPPSEVNKGYGLVQNPGWE